MGWFWNSFQGLPLSPREIEQLVDILKDRQSAFRKGHYSLIWLPSKLGQYDAKEGYHLLANQMENYDLGIPQKLFWSNKLIAKAGVFAWLATRRKILTTDKFRRMGSQGPSRCILCKAQEESVDHLLLNCSFTAKCWRWLCAKLGWITTLPNDIVSLFQGWPISPHNGILSSLWGVNTSCLVWEVWKERNRRIFWNKARKLGSVLNSLEVSIVENINNMLALDLSVGKKNLTDSDDRIRSGWPGIKIPSFLGGIGDK
ncbi:uncharacterized protein LOC131876305 [Cryptomeria japonica]|uniref:uncharacterized protein LOC131876305 n=1 Tax=Cryptomeria japonica TaxID=3369 RepID=UPI0027DA09D4|nr:uncharacterized protein LOC131876305 [Cryptomeria japonica]